MIAKLLINWILAACAFAITAWLLNGMSVSGGVWGYLWVSLLFGLVNVTVGTILRLLTLPFIILTLGLLLILINAAVLGIVDWLSRDLTIDSFFWTTIWAAIILSVVSVVLDFVADRALRRD